MFILDLGRFPQKLPDEPQRFLPGPSWPQRKLARSGFRWVSFRQPHLRIVQSTPIIPFLVSQAPGATSRGNSWEL
jgi:hypothetical protein